LTSSGPTTPRAFAKGVKASKYGEVEAVASWGLSSARLGAGGEDNLLRLDWVNELARRRRLSPIVITVAWVLQQPFPTDAVKGCRTEAGTRSTWESLAVDSRSCSVLAASMGFLARKILRAGLGGDSLGVMVRPFSFRVTAALAGLALSTLLLGADSEVPDWRVLFDGSSTEEWRGFRQETFPAGGWKVADGVLATVAGLDRKDIVTRDTFGDFELSFEWSLPLGGNSGIFFWVDEAVPVIWHHAPEIQILDDKAFDQAADTLLASGSLYDLVPPLAEKKLRPLGEFNSNRLVVRGSEIEYWLNGEKILKADLDSPEVRERIAASKFGEHEGFAQKRPGRIGLQHHGEEAAFRNIRIRELP
jgi:hypothetical protein